MGCYLNRCRCDANRCHLSPIGSPGLCNSWGFCKVLQFPHISQTFLGFPGYPPLFVILYLSVLKFARCGCVAKNASLVSYFGACVAALVEDCLILDSQLTSMNTGSLVDAMMFIVGNFFLFLLLIMALVLALGAPKLQRFKFVASGRDSRTP